MSSPLVSSHAIATWAGVAPDLGRDGCDFVGEAQVALEVLAGEPGIGLAPEVVVVEVLHRANLAGQEAMSEWGIRNEPDTEVAQSSAARPASGIARPQRVLGLQCRNRVHGVGAADRVHPGLG